MKSRQQYFGMYAWPLFAVCQVLFAFFSFSHAEIIPSERLEATAYLKNQYLLEDNRDLGMRDDDPSRSFTVEGRGAFGYRPYDDLLLFAEGRFVKINGDRFVDTTTGQSFGGEDFLELRQFYALHTLNNVTPHLNVQIGRQRIREPYGLWWNRDQDAVRLNYDTTQFSGFFAIGENLASYRTGNNDFRDDEENRFRIMAEGSWLLPRYHHIDLRALYEYDYSGTPETGRLIEATNRDDEDHRLLWGGLRLTGGPQPVSVIKGDKNILLSYRADLAGVAGHADNLQAASVGDGRQRRVDGVNNVDVLGWAFDGQIDLAFEELLFRPVLTVGYAYGSGDNNQGAGGTDNHFRQSDLQSNLSPIAGTRRLAYNYGEVLRPELSNLHIAKAGLTFGLTPATDFSMMYYRYRLADNGSPLRSSRIRQRTGGDSHDVGQELDVYLTSDLEQQFDFDLPLARTLQFRSSLGLFKAGDAYQSAEDEIAVRGLAELVVRF